MWQKLLVKKIQIPHVYTHTHPFNGPLSGTTRVSRYQKGKTNLDFTEARDSDWQWNPLGHMQVCTSLQTDNHASTSLLEFFTGRMPFLPPNQQCQSTEALPREQQMDQIVNLAMFTMDRTVTQLTAAIVTTDISMMLRYLRASYISIRYEYSGPTAWQLLQSTSSSSKSSLRSSCTPQTHGGLRDGRRPKTTTSCYSPWHPFWPLWTLNSTTKLSKN